MGCLLLVNVLATLALGALLGATLARGDPWWAMLCVGCGRATTLLALQRTLWLWRRRR